MTDETFNLVLDYETYYDDAYSLRKLTTAEYICDPRFHVHMCGVQFAGGQPAVLSGAQLPKFFAMLPWDRVNMICHNSQFDGAITAWKYGYKPRLYVDTLGMSRALIGANAAKHGLNDTAQYLGLGGKQGYNPNSGEALALAAVKGKLNLTQQEYDDLAYYCGHAPNSDIALTWQVYEKLAQSFPATEYELLDWTIRMFVETALCLDGPMLKQYEKEVREEKAALVAATGKPKTWFTSNDKFAALLKMHNVEPPKKWSKTTGKSTYAFAKNDLEFTTLASEHPDPVVRQLIECRLAVKSSIEETRAATMHRISEIPGARVPVPLNYSGAMNTHRLSGGGGYNMQNFKRGGTLRKAINGGKDENGNDLYCYVADLSGIELRVAIALTNDFQRVELLRAKEDLYCHTATGLFGEAVLPKETNGQPTPGYQEDPMYQRRLVGKVADLSLQYGAGEVAFQGMLRTMGKVLWEQEHCKSVVDTWRLTHGDTLQRWDQCGQAARTMLRGGTPKDWIISTADNQPVFTFESDGILLPRGLRIKYPNLRMVEEEHRVGDKVTVRKQLVYDDARSANGYAKLYGGKMFENLCIDINTLLPTSNGVKRLEDVSLTDKVWDGVEWVTHSGFISKGCKPVIEAHGVHMTPEHEVLTVEGWKCASQSQGLERAEVRLPDGYDVRRYERAAQRLGHGLRLRRYSAQRPCRPTQAREAWGYTALREGLRYASSTWHAPLERAPSLRCVGVNESEMLEAVAQRVSELRRAWHSSLRALVGRVSTVLGGHGTELCTGLGSGPRGQQRKLRAFQLPVGVSQRELQEQTQHRTYQRSGHARKLDDGAAFGTIGHREVDTELQTKGRLANTRDLGETGIEVGDLIDCGPRNRFTVLDKNGDPLIVHNCQALATNIYLDQVRLINRIHPVKLSVHDEVVLVGSYDKLRSLAPFVEHIMRTPPTWWPNLPLEVESDIAHRYGDAK